MCESCKGCVMPCKQNDGQYHACQISKDTAARAAEEADRRKWDEKK